MLTWKLESVAFLVFFPPPLRCSGFLCVFSGSSQRGASETCSALFSTPCVRSRVSPLSWCLLLWCISVTLSSLLFSLSLFLLLSFQRIFLKPESVAFSASCVFSVAKQMLDTKSLLRTECFAFVIYSPLSVLLLLFFFPAVVWWCFHVKFLLFFSFFSVL